MNNFFYATSKAELQAIKVSLLNNRDQAFVLADDKNSLGTYLLVPYDASKVGTSDLFLSVDDDTLNQYMWAFVVGSCSLSGGPSSYYDYPVRLYLKDSEFPVPPLGWVKTALCTHVPAVGQKVFSTGADVMYDCTFMYFPDYNRLLVVGQSHYSVYNLSSQQVEVQGASLPSITSAYSWQFIRAGNICLVLNSDAGNYFDIATLTWGTGKTSSPRNGVLGAAINYNNKVYVIGQTGTDVPLAKCQIYDPASDRWSASVSYTNHDVDSYGQISNPNWYHPVDSLGKAYFTRGGYLYEIDLTSGATNVIQGVTGDNIGSINFIYAYELFLVGTDPVNDSYMHRQKFSVNPVTSVLHDYPRHLFPKPIDTVNSSSCPTIQIGDYVYYRSNCGFIRKVDIYRGFVSMYSTDLGGYYYSNWSSIAP